MKNLQFKMSDTDSDEEIECQVTSLTEAFQVLSKNAKGQLKL